ncbi:hypothetical protein [Microbulbifer rhizosphaerae]|uniref:Uncharacterized protein n=1 Tax=Microbulbifer rhizosphaerae TaxID=1562603 RepID=A0A7W4W7P7_9GAMM|nr:hypothetical protein [Microbulbifer rhizosphaerae]MBB3059205.1 hypothetical protein [Microbulbifer rhizosphaerae]
MGVQESSSSIKDKELKALYAKTLFGYSDREIVKAVKAGILIEVNDDG